MVKKNNSKGLQINDIVSHIEDNCFGRVVDVEYNDADEATIEWFGEWSKWRTRRTSIKYLKLETSVFRNHETEK